MAVSKQTKTREGTLTSWWRAFRSSRIRPRGSQAQVRAAALRERRLRPGGSAGRGSTEGPHGQTGESNPPARPPLVFGVGLVAVVFVVSLVALKFDIPQLFPMLAAGVGAIAGFWLFEEIRRLF